MAKDTHKILRRLADEFIKDSTDENSSALLNEIIRILMRNEDVIINGTPIEGADGQVEPSAIMVEDKVFLCIYTDHDRFEQCGCTAAFVTNLQALLSIVFSEQGIGGICINYAKGKETVLVSKEQIYDALQEYTKSREVENG